MRQHGGFGVGAARLRGEVALGQEALGTGYRGAGSSSASGTWRPRAASHGVVSAAALTHDIELIVWDTAGMSALRIALANVPYPETRDASVEQACAAIATAGAARASIVCFPECYVPGYRAADKGVLPADPAWLAEAVEEVGKAAAAAGAAVVLGTERVTPAGLHASAIVLGADGSILGIQDKVQIDPSEEGLYAPGDGRRVFTVGDVTFGVTICHEGWRYPETVRWAARRGAQVVFHQAFHEAGPGSYRPTTFADPANTFHEKAVLCRAAENTCYVATVNYASEGSPTTSAVARPDGTVLAWQPYGIGGLLIADLDLSAATGLLAMRCRTGM